MKKLMLAAAFGFCTSHLPGQPVLSNVYATDPPVAWVKVNDTDLKYLRLEKDTVNPNPYIGFKLYNADHTLFKSVSVPPFPGKYCFSISYITQTLFDTDTLIEYIAGYAINQFPNTQAVRIVNENGTILLERDTCSTGTNAAPYDVNQIFQTIFPDGTNTKLMLFKYTPVPGFGTMAHTATEIYDLPGRLPCLTCDNGSVSGFIPSPAYSVAGPNSLAFPNPFTEQVVIRYSLPQGVSRAMLALFDLQGRLISERPLDRHAGEISVRANELARGAYTYRISADGQVIAGDLIIKH